MPDPPELIVRVVGARFVFSRPLAEAAESDTLPLNPLMLVRVIWDAPDPLFAKLAVDGFADILKSPLLDTLVTVNEMLPLCEMLPLVPVTVIE